MQGWLFLVKVLHVCTVKWMYFSNGNCECDLSIFLDVKVPTVGVRVTGETGMDLTGNRAGNLDQPI
jgi:hypothetical protein